MSDIRIQHGYRLPRYVAATITSEGAMLLDTRRRGTWFTTNPAGARLLAELLDGANLDHAARIVADHYSALQADVWIDMAKLTEDLCNRGLLMRPVLGSNKW